MRLPNITATNRMVVICNPYKWVDDRNERLKTHSNYEITRWEKR